MLTPMQKGKVLVRAKHFIKSIQQGYARRFPTTLLAWLDASTDEEVEVFMTRIQRSLKLTNAGWERK